MRQRWLFTDQPFFPVGTGCVFMNRIWDGDDASDYRLGMVQPVIANYQQDARWHLTPGLTGKHICHEEWLATGEPPNELPPTDYDANWIPTCCGVGTSGGIEIGGSAGDVFTPHRWGDTCCDAIISETGVSYTYNYSFGDPSSVWYRFAPGAGWYRLTLDADPHFVSFANGTRGPACNNQTDTIFNFQFPPIVQEFALVADDTLCIVVGHTLSVVPFSFTLRLDYLGPTRPPDPTAGGMEAGGSVGDLYFPSDALAGGMEAGGRVGDLSSSTDAMAGGVEVGGLVGDLIATTDAAAGGVELGGTSGDTLSATDALAGGVEIGGGTGDTNAATDGAQGGVALGGSVGEEPGGIDGTSGGASLGGSSGDVPSGTDGSAGGVEAGGSAGDTITTTDATAGGVQLGGAAGDKTAGIDATAGGVEVGGLVGDRITTTDATAGGVQAGGQVGDRTAGIDHTAGGVQLGGSAGDVFSSPPSVRAVSSGDLASGWVLPTRVAGDKLVVFFARSGATNPVANSGWVREFSQNWGTSFANAWAVFTRTATGTDGTPTTAATGAFIAFSVQNPTATDSAQANLPGVASNSINCPSNAVTATDVVFRAWVSPDLLDTASYPGGYTMNHIWTTNPQITVGYKTSSTNPTGNEAATISANRLWVSATVCIK